METRRAPLGLRILIVITLFLITFLAFRPSDPATQVQIEFWKHAAAYFGEHDIEGFVGIALLVVSTAVTIIGYQIVIRLIQRILNKGRKIAVANPS
ncbi:hypothetical protein [Enterobacter sp. KBR-315C3_2022]|jgi:hypothetical protein|uniref:hypothetical protein n=1 Tax=Enterobacter sp. KBR-315C3_2022 TaxID=3242494 RepID=UPI0035284B6D